MLVREFEQPAALSVHHLLAELRAALVPVLMPWCPSFGGLRLYYSGHRFVPARLRALIDLVHELRPNPV